MEEKITTLTFVANQNSVRLDQFLVSVNTDFSRSYIQKLIKDGYISVDEKIQKKTGFLIMSGMKISMTVPDIQAPSIEPEKMDLDIIYEDKDIILINKPKDMVVHPAPGHYEHTLVNGLLYHCGEELSGINGEMRPGIVHRIDKDTTGVIVACKNDMAHRFLSSQLEVHSIHRKYQAIVYNNFSTEIGTVDAPIGRHPVDRKKMAINYKNGKHAITHYKVLNHLDKSVNHIECSLETGRTHQIRVHMASIKHPLVGDEIYGPCKVPAIYKNLQGQTLHAKTLGFIHPTTKKYMEFEAPLPEYFQNLLKKLDNT